MAKAGTYMGRASALRASPLFSPRLTRRLRLGTALSWRRSSQLQALDHLRRAMRLDPNCALAAALAGWCHIKRATPWNSTAVEEQAQAHELADLAGLIDPANPNPGATSHGCPRVEEVCKRV